MPTKLNIQAFAGQLIDYAGLFPPASLSLDEAVDNFSRYQSSEDAWVLSRFICPVGKLKQLHTHMDEFSKKSPLNLSILCRPGSDRQDFLTKLSEDISTSIAFEGKNKVSSFDSVEVRLPASHGNEESILQAASTLVKDLRPELNVFFELSFEKNWHMDLKRIVGFIAKINQSRGRGLPKIGLKMRCGGIVPEAFPGVDKVASVLVACHTNKIPLKFTAGLHHPLPHFDSSIETTMHGFVNIFGAGMLATIYDWKEAEVEEVLLDQDPSNFSFENGGFSWKEFRVSELELEKLRKNALLSYGSCSFEEPISDLKDLGWL